MEGLYNLSAPTRFFSLSTHYAAHTDAFWQREVRNLLSILKKALNEPEPLLLSAVCFAHKMRQEVTGFRKRKLATNTEEPSLGTACFKETVVLGTEDSSFPLPVKKPHDKYVLGAQGYGLNIKQWIAIMWKVDLESRQWRTHAGAVFVPPCRGQLA